jgi:hypothetical protein
MREIMVAGEKGSMGAGETENFRVTGKAKSGRQFF